LERVWDGILIVGSHNAGCPNQDARNLAVSLLVGHQDILGRLAHAVTIIAPPWPSNDRGGT
jgi:hypothetical protein